jgi:AGZA family xanthine/uracil permease-like MFS transporter
MLLAAAVAEVIDQRFVRASLWAFAGAALSAVGLIHAYRFTPADTAVALAPSLEHSVGYAAMGLVLLAARWVTLPGEEHA